MTSSVGWRAAPQPDRDRLPSTAAQRRCIPSRPRPRLARQDHLALALRSSALGPRAFTIAPAPA
jgi:hypothetical protein